MFHRYPFTDYQELNLDWVIRKIKELETKEASQTAHASKTEYGIVKVGDGIDVNDGVISTDKYTLPTASANTLGGVKIGNGINIENGTISTEPYQLPVASATRLGGVKIGSGLTIESGVLSTTNGGGGTPSAGDTVVVTTKLDSGVNIADISVNGVNHQLFAPEGGGTAPTGDTIMVTPKVTEGVNIADISVNGTNYQLYAPESTPGGGSGDTVVVDPTLDSGVSIANITVNDTAYTLYAPPTPEIPVNNDVDPNMGINNIIPEVTYYIDTVNGSDDNDGLTVDRAMRSLAGAIKKYPPTFNTENIYEYQYNNVTSSFDPDSSVSKPTIEINGYCTLTCKPHKYVDQQTSVINLNMNINVLGGTLNIGKLHRAFPADEAGGVDRFNINNLNILVRENAMLVLNKSQINGTSMVPSITLFGTLIISRNSSAVGAHNPLISFDTANFLIYHTAKIYFCGITMLNTKTDINNESALNIADTRYVYLAQNVGPFPEIYLVDCHCQTKYLCNGIACIYYNTLDVTQCQNSVSFKMI